MDDLFDFSGGAETIATAPAAGTKHKRGETSGSAPNSSSKNKQTPVDETMEDGDAESPSSSEDGSDEEDEEGAGGPPRKRARKHAPAPIPVVLDELATEVKRELPANPGLSAGAEAESGSLLLTHQVS